MSKHEGASEHAGKDSRPSNSATGYEIDVTGLISESLMEQCMHMKFKHLGCDERRPAIKESLEEAEHQLKGNLKAIKLLEEKIVILKRFLSDA